LSRLIGKNIRMHVARVKRGRKKPREARRRNGEDVEEREEGREDLTASAAAK